jgi:hypothetical protein
MDRDFMFRSGAQGMLLAMNGPAQIRGVLTDMANRDLSVRFGEDMSRRSRHEDRADSRLKSLQRSAIVAAGVAYLLGRRRRGL